MTSLLFVYGTLRKDSENGMFHLLRREASFVGRARMQGRLFHLGGYPGLVPCSDPGSFVRGEVYNLTNPAVTLACLDGYEGCGTSDPEPHEFERIENGVLLEDGGRGNAWVYVYKGSTTGRREIVSGDYLEEDPCHSG